jgi:hypothetical protein
VKYINMPFLRCCCFVQPHDNYNYDRHGLDWTDKGDCGLDGQSPIDILTDKLTSDSSARNVSAIDFNNFAGLDSSHNITINLEVDQKMVRVWGVLCACHPLSCSINLPVCVRSLDVHAVDYV